MYILKCCLLKNWFLKGFQYSCRLSQRIWKVCGFWARILEHSSRVQVFLPRWTIAHQAAVSMGFSQAWTYMSQMMKMDLLSSMGQSREHPGITLYGGKNRKENIAVAVSHWTNFLYTWNKPITDRQLCSNVKKQPKNKRKKAKASHGVMLPSCGHVW